MIKTDAKLDVRLTANKTNDLNIQLKIQKAIKSKNAIRDKFNLSANMPFSKYADNIKVGGSEDLYKCAEVFKQEPLRLTAVKDGTKFAFQKISNYFNATEYAKWKFRTNNDPEWKSCADSGIDDHYSYKFLTMAAGDWIEVEGNTTNCAGVGFTIGSQKDDSQGSYNMLASGDVMSLLGYSDTVPKGAFYQLFRYCSLSSLPDLSKIHIIGQDGCREMFFNYNNTYSADIVLNLQSVDFAGCYQMFYGNWWWVTPSATPTMRVTLKIDQFTHNEACNSMFGCCKYLNAIKFYNNNWATNYSNTFYGWVDSVASSGTFYAVSDLPIENSSSRIPSSWTVKTFNPAADPIPEVGSDLGWNGYKLVKGTEGYTVDATLTSGLTYSILIPEVGFIYNADATFKVEQIIGNISKPEIVSVDIIPAINVEEGTAITEINLNNYYIVRDSIVMNQIGTAAFNVISLPDGLTLSGSKLSGTPTTAGEGNISILATYPGATDVTITIAYAITAKPSGGSIDLLVEGAGTSSFNGTYKLVNTSATGNDRVWKHTDNNSHVFFWSGTNKWLMQVGAEVTGPPAYASAAGVADPWEGTWGNEDGALPAPTVTAVGGNGGGSDATTVTVTGFASVEFGDLDGTYTDDGTGVRFVNDKDYSIRWVKSSENIMFGPAQDQWCIVGPDGGYVYACIGGTEGDVSSIACTDKNIQLQVDAYNPPVTIVVSSGGSSGGEITYTGNLVCAGFPEPVSTPMGNINANGVWQLGRLNLSSGEFTADSTVTGTDRAWKAPDGSGYIYRDSYQSGYWYMDPLGGLCMFQGINPTINGTDSPYKDDGTSFDWTSMGSALTGATVIPEQVGSTDSDVPTITISGAYEYMNHFNGTYVYNAEIQSWVNPSGDYIYWDETQWTLINSAYGTNTFLGGTLNDIASIAGTKSVMFDGEPANSCQVTITVE